MPGDAELRKGKEMKIPKYIDLALKRRTRGAEMFNTNDWIISNFIDKHEIDAELEDYHGGVESVVHPYDSEEQIRERILQSSGKARR